MIVGGLLFFEIVRVQPPASCLENEHEDQEDIILKISVASGVVGSTMCRF